MVGWRVSRRVNNPRLPNDASLIEPVGRSEAVQPAQGVMAFYKGGEAPEEE